MAVKRRDPEYPGTMCEPESRAHRGVTSRGMRLQHSVLRSVSDWRDDGFQSSRRISLSVSMSLTRLNRCHGTAQRSAESFHLNHDAGALTDGQHDDDDDDDDDADDDDDDDDDDDGDDDDDDDDGDDDDDDDDDNDDGDGDGDGDDDDNGGGGGGDDDDDEEEEEEAGGCARRSRG
eukprot:3939189-Rhodomonas_salina.1